MTARQVSNAIDWTEVLRRESVQDFLRSWTEFAQAHAVTGHKVTRQWYYILCSIQCNINWCCSIDAATHEHENECHIWLYISQRDSCCCCNKLMGVRPDWMSAVVKCTVARFCQHSRIPLHLLLMFTSQTPETLHKLQNHYANSRNFTTEIEVSFSTV